MFKVTLGAMLLMGVMSSLVGSGSLALFTDTDEITGNAFDTGEISLTLSDTSAFLTAADMMPGDSVSDRLVVTNAGDSQLRYAVTATVTAASSSDLEGTLQLLIVAEDGDDDCDATDFGGTALYNGDIDGDTSDKILGDSAAGSDTGDRTLNAAANEDLCWKASMPSGATGPEGDSVTVKFTFSSEQTDNNP